MRFLAMLILNIFRRLIVIDSRLRAVVSHQPAKKQKPRRTTGLSVIRVKMILRGRDAHHAAFRGALDAELDRPVDFCEQSMIFADPDVVAGVKFGTALAHDNAARPE